MPTLRQLEYLVAVAEEGSFTRAAARMHVSQPSLSQQVRLLENELGGKLIERLPRSVKLTSAGKALLPHARNAVHFADRATRAARAALALELGELEITTVRSISLGLLPGVIGRWRRHSPKTLVRIHEFTHRRLAEDAVRDGIGDIGIGPPPRDWGGPVEHLGWEEFVIVLGADDPLAGRERLRLDELADREWVMFDTDNGLYDVVVAACAIASHVPFKPRQAVCTAQVEAAARLAGAGVGPTLVPENVVPAGLEGAVVRVQPAVGRELTVYARDDWSPLAREFLAIMREHAEWSPPPPTARLIS